MFFERIPDFCKDAANVYRTKQYIVKQDISLERDGNGDIIVLSTDVLYERTPLRDKQYERVFAKRKFINGKRVPSTSYSRRYVK